MSSKNQKLLDAMLNQIDRANREIANWLIENPDGLEGNPRKSEIIQMVVMYLNSRNAQCNSKGYANRRYTLRFAAMLQDLEEANQKDKLKYAQKIAKEVINACTTELEMIPKEMKSELFMVTVQYFTEN